LLSSTECLRVLNRFPFPLTAKTLATIRRVSLEAEVGGPNKFKKSDGKPERAQENFPNRLKQHNDTVPDFEKYRRGGEATYAA
jgi:hypothetical protein